MSPPQQKLKQRLGLNIPYEWWPSAPALKAIEAAGFAWVQVAAPPVEMLADPRHGVRHATALRGARVEAARTHRRGASGPGLPGEPLPRVPGAIERLPRPAVGPPPGEEARLP